MEGERKNSLSCFSSNGTTSNYTGEPQPSFVEEVLHEEQTGGENLSVNVRPAPVNPDLKEERKRGSSSGYPIKKRWIPEEDRRLVSLVHQYEHYGSRKWALIAEQMAGRVGKRCRERWFNNLNPDIKKDRVWTADEERLLIQEHERLGNRWTQIAKSIPRRSENSIKNHWYETKRKLEDPKGGRQKIKKLKGDRRQSTLLQDYIIRKYFSNGSTSTSTNSNSGTTSTAENPSKATTPLSNDDDLARYLNFESLINDEMDFTKKVFGNNDRSIDSVPVDHRRPMNPAEGTSENAYQINREFNSNFGSVETEAWDGGNSGNINSTTNLPTIDQGTTFGSIMEMDWTDTVLNIVDSSMHM